MNQQKYYQESIDAVALLKSCAKRKDLNKVCRFHAEILRRKLLEKDLFIGSTLISIYVKCGALATAQEVLDQIPQPDVVSWTALMVGYARNGQYEETLRCFKQMQNEGICPDAFTFVCMLKACASIKAHNEGQKAHAGITGEKGLIERNIIIGTTLVDMYAKCGFIGKAREVFDDIQIRNVVLWNALITGYVQNEHSEEALTCFGLMQQEGFSPDKFTFTCVLKACGRLGAFDKGEEVHIQIVRQRLLQKDVLLGTALLDMYCKLGVFEKIEYVFDSLPIQDIVSWTVLISGYAQHGHVEKALSYFERLQHIGITPNEVTIVCILRACGSIGAFVKGKLIHTGIIMRKESFEEKDILIGTSLVDMYSICGSPVDAHRVFENLQVRDTVAWTTLINAYSQLGKYDMVVNLVNEMQEEGIKPSPITFMAILNVCSHSGLVDKGQMYFEIMSTKYGITPMLEHYVCMIDLLSRVGCIDKAIVLIKYMPVIDNLAMLITILNGCRRSGNVEVGRMAFGDASQMDGKDGGVYVCMSNIYAAAELKMEEIVR